MLGRALFAVVWLTIVAGLLLPLYPRDPGTPTLAAADSVLLATDFTASSCQDCPVADEGGADCRSDCPCGKLLPAAFPSENAFSLSVIVTIRPIPLGLSSEIEPLPPKLPAV